MSVRFLQFLLLYLLIAQWTGNGPGADAFALPGLGGSPLGGGGGGPPQVKLIRPPEDIQQVMVFTPGPPKGSNEQGSGDEDTSAEDGGTDEEAHHESSKMKSSNHRRASHALSPKRLNHRHSKKRHHSQKPNIQRVGRHLQSFMSHVLGYTPPTESPGGKTSKFTWNGLFNALMDNPGGHHNKRHKTSRPHADDHGNNSDDHRAEPPAHEKKPDKETPEKPQEKKEQATKKASPIFIPSKSISPPQSAKKWPMPYNLFNMPPYFNPFLPFAPPGNSSWKNPIWRGNYLQPSHPTFPLSSIAHPPPSPNGRGYWNPIMSNWMSSLYPGNQAYSPRSGGAMLGGTRPYQPSYYTGGGYPGFRGSAPYSVSPYVNPAYSNPFYANSAYNSPWNPTGLPASYGSQASSFPPGSPMGFPMNGPPQNQQPTSYGDIASPIGQTGGGAIPGALPPQQSSMTQGFNSPYGSLSYQSRLSNPSQQGANANYNNPQKGPITQTPHSSAQNAALQDGSSMSNASRSGNPMVAANQGGSPVGNNQYGSSSSTGNSTGIPEGRSLSGQAPANYAGGTCGSATNLSNSNLANTGSTSNGVSGQNSQSYPL